MHDAHNHLHCFPDAETQLRGVGDSVRRQMVAGLHPLDWPTLATLHQQFPEHIVPAFGVHPWFANSLPADWHIALREMLLSHNTAAVGECGVDRLRGPLTPAQQAELLETHLQLALELRRGIVLHVVRAWDLAAPVLDANAGQRPVLLHAFSPRGLLNQDWTRWNAWFSFRAESLARPSAALAELIGTLPPDRLLIESDIHPTSASDATCWDQANSRLDASLNSLASLLGKAPEEIEARTDANFALWCAACREPSPDSA